MPTTIINSENGITLGGTKTIESKEFYDKQLELIINSDGGLEEYFDVDTQAYNTGKKFTYRKMMPIEPPTKPLEEGVVPDPNKISLREYEASMSPWGDYLLISDEMKKYAIDDLMSDTTEQLGNSAVELMRRQQAKAMLTSRNRWFAGVSDENITGDLATIRSSTTAFNLEDLPKISAYLKHLRVQPWVGTDYVILIPTEVEATLLTLKKSSSQFSFVELTKNSNYEPVVKGEIGKVLGFRFVTTPYLEVKDGQAQCVILGKFNNKKPLLMKGVGFKPGSSKAQIIVKDFGSAGPNDPINQRASIAYKIDAWTAVVKADQAVLIYECKSDVEFNDKYPIEAESLVKSQVNTGSDGTTGVVTPNKVIGNGLTEKPLADTGLTEASLSKETRAKK